MIGRTLGRLDELPRLGWVDEPTPITGLPELARRLGLASLGVKRDDLCSALHGGSKVRKLDYLLAQERYRQADGWVSIGAIGSGNLSTLAAAARELGRQLDVHMFWEPADARVLEDLSYTASVANQIRYRHTRVGLALRYPGVFITKTYRSSAVIPPGSTTTTAMLGMVRAGLEICAQVESGDLPPPDRLVVPLGTGGVCAGTAMGLALGGLRPRIHAVSTVERPFATRGRLRGLTVRLAKMLDHLGLGTLEVPEIHIDRRWLGEAYGVPSPASSAAVTALADDGIGLEPIYSGKAMAAVLGGACEAGENVLFFLTPRRAGPLAVGPSWKERLPRRLLRRLSTCAEEH